jgi:antitoxin CptB
MTEMSRLRWMCRRGMKELDVVLTRYLDERYVDSSDAEQALFRQLLQMPDPDLYDLLLRRTRTDDAELAHLLQVLRR